MQNRRAFFSLALALILGIGAAFAAQRLLERTPTVRQEPVETVPVVVARMDVAVGSALQRQHLDTVDWPKRYRPDGAVTEPAKLRGRVLRRPVSAGEPVLEPFLLPAGAEAGLGSVITSKSRAVSVKVDDVIAVAGFVKPGARVDVLATLRRIDRNGAPHSKVILQDIPVLAVDQTMEEARNGEPKASSVVTLEVNPEQAEKLIYSAHEGQLQLALRNPADHDQVATRSVSVADLLGGRPAPKRSKPQSRTGVQLIRGSQVSVKAF